MLASQARHAVRNLYGAESKIKRVFDILKGKRELIESKKGSHFFDR